MTNPDPRFQREFADDALRTLNEYRFRAGRQPLTKDNQLACSDEAWAKMSAAEKAELWRRFGIEPQAPSSESTE